MYYHNVITYFDTNKMNNLAFDLVTEEAEDIASLQYVFQRFKDLGIRNIFAVELVATEENTYESLLLSDHDFSDCIFYDTLNDFIEAIKGSSKG